MGYKNNRNLVYSCKNHVVWCPKFRRPILTEGIEERLRAILAGVVVRARSDLLNIEVVPDHVLLLVEVDPRFGIHKLVKLAKGRSTRLLRQEFPRLRSCLPTLWMNSDFVSTVGTSPWTMVKKNVEDQKRV